MHNDPGIWIRANSAFSGIVDRELFSAVQTIISARSFRLSNEKMLSRLNSLYHREGVLSGLVIDEDDGLPSSGA